MYSFSDGGSKRPSALGRTIDSPVAADVSRRHFRCRKSAPTNVGGYRLLTIRAWYELSWLVIAVALLASLGSTIRAAEPAEKPLYLDPAQPAGERARDLIARLAVEEPAMLLNHKGTTVERFAIKCDRWNQCLHGVCWDRPTTMFPVPIALRSEE